MKGKAKCKALKEIRRQIAETNDIPYAVSQCTYQGDCAGTCPKCEAELKYLERELAIRQSLGKAVAITGISMGVCASLTACTPEDLLQIIPGFENELGGDTVPVEGEMPEPQTPGAETPDIEGMMEEPEPQSPGVETPESPEKEPEDEKGQNPSPETPQDEIDDGTIAGAVEIIEPETENIDGDIDINTDKTNR